MKAYILKNHGKPHVLKMKEIPEPIPAKDEIRVELKYIGLNYAEILKRQGLYD